MMCLSQPLLQPLLVGWDPLQSCQASCWVVASPIPQWPDPTTQKKRGWKNSKWIFTMQFFLSSLSPFEMLLIFVSSLGSMPTASKVSFRPRLVQLILCLSGWVTWKSTHVGGRIQGLGIDTAITAESRDSRHWGSKLASSFHSRFFPDVGCSVRKTI